MVKLTKAKPKGRKIYKETGKKDTGRKDKYSDDSPKKDFDDYRKDNPKVSRVRRSKK